MNFEIDVRHVLPAVHVPTLIIHRTHDMTLRVEGSRDMVKRISGARYVELPGADHLPFVGDQDAILDEIEEFLTGMHRGLAVLVPLRFGAPARVRGIRGTLRSERAATAGAEARSRGLRTPRECLSSA
jgi:hypothetical protein